jgi:hypothetical protein
VLGQLFVTTVQQPVTVALAAILFDGEVQIGWRCSAEPLARVPPTVRPASRDPIGRLAPLLPVPAVANLAVPTDPTRLPA